MTEGRNGWQPKVHDAAQVAHTPLSMSLEPQEAVKPSNKDVPAGHFAWKDIFHLTAAFWGILAT